MSLLLFTTKQQHIPDPSPESQISSLYIFTFHISFKTVNNLLALNVVRSDCSEKTILYKSMMRKDIHIYVSHKIIRKI